MIDVLFHIIGAILAVVFVIGLLYYAMILLIKSAPYLEGGYVESELRRRLCELELLKTQKRIDDYKKRGKKQ